MKLSVPKIAYAVIFLCVVAYAFATLRGPNGIAALVDKQHRIQDLEKHNASLAEEVERKRERIKRLADSPSEQELEIRRRLKLARPNEKVFVVGEPAKK